MTCDICAINDTITDAVSICDVCGFHVCADCQYEEIAELGIRIIVNRAYADDHDHIDDALLGR